ncbi:MAG: FAD-dependent oxidoreductase [Wenzhouxiangella sp.]
MKVAIIGAGIAGLSAADRLREVGADCTVFEKSRGLGGRMATRRVNDLEFDHGAQYWLSLPPRSVRWLPRPGCSLSNWIASAMRPA